jgi:hypothetical protein
MGLPEFSMARHFKMVLPGQDNKNAPTLTNDDSSDTSQRPTPTFGGLPAELKRLVVHHAEDSCLANPRLNKKELDAITVKSLDERPLAEQRFMRSEYSLCKILL